MCFKLFKHKLLFKCLTKHSFVLQYITDAQRLKIHTKTTLIYKTLQGYCFLITYLTSKKPLVEYYKKDQHFI